MADFIKLQEEICKAACAAGETVELASKETLPYELSKSITLEEISDMAYEEGEGQYTPEATVLRFQAFVSHKFDFANRMIQSITESMSHTGEYDNSLPGYLGIRDGCEIANAIIGKMLGHWVEPEAHD